ncbi:Site-specific DNA-methyltransferase (adenine-specific) [Bordetella sputigena]
MGSGAVALNIAPRRALLADTNQHIVRFYQQIQDRTITPAVVKQFLEDEGAALLLKGEEHYYNVRKRFNEHANPLDLLFLNRSCFNGMMRFNTKGGFNVPFCRKPDRFRQALITKICNQVARAQSAIGDKDWVFKCQSWRETFAEVRGEDFVYMDPPYVGRHADYYTKWSDEEATELAKAIRALPAGFAYSMWKENQYRENAHLTEHFSDFAVETFSHFYHLGASESMRNEMEEALVLSHGNLADAASRPAPPELKDDDDDAELTEPPQQQLFA